MVSKRAKLKPSAVRLLRKKHKQGASQMKLAKEHGISQSAVHNILSGKTYKGVV